MKGKELGMKNDTSSQTTWFVGASYGGTDDQTPRFLKEGIWENGYDDKLLDMVRAMQPGEALPSRRPLYAQAWPALR